MRMPLLFQLESIWETEKRTNAANSNVFVSSAKASQASDVGSIPIARTHPLMHNGGHSISARLKSTL